MLSLSGIVCLYACMKSVHVDTSTSSGLQGRWDVVSDSAFQGIGYNNHPVDYTGMPGDYFDFRSNGYLYTNENGVQDTLPYQFTSDSSMVIGALGLIFNGTPEATEIIGLTAHSATLKAPIVVTSAGEFGRTVHLSR